MFNARHGLGRLVWLAAGILCALAQPAAMAAQHTVKEGDTLTALSRKYGVSVSEIRAANGLDGDNILLGKALKIPKPVGKTQPAPGTGSGPVQVRRAQPVDPKQLPKRKPTAAGGGAYTVQPGDSLSKLAARYGTTVAAIKAANGLDGEGINAGQALVIPEKGKTPKAAPEKRAEAPKPLPAQKAPSTPSTATTAGTEHYVLEGDRLSLLAKRYGVSVEVIRQANKLEGDLIRVGQLLVIPVRGTQASAVPPAAPTAPGLPAMDQGSARDILARATPGASRPVANVPVWEQPGHYLDLVNLGDPTGGAPPSDLPAPPATEQTPEPVPAPAPTTPRRAHVVEEGDSLWKIARQYKVSIDQIQEANGIADDGIQIGQKLVVP